MNYVLPQKVLAPVGRISKLKVLYDGGLGKDGDPWGGWSYAQCLWDGEPADVMRWNNTESGGQVQLGFPLLHGNLPGWFVVPGPCADAMRLTILKFAEMHKNATTAA
jgi:hypothetical protein